VCGRHVTRQACLQQSHWGAWPRCFRLNKRPQALIQSHPAKAVAPGLAGRKEEAGGNGSAIRRRHVVVHLLDAAGGPCVRGLRQRVIFSVRGGGPMGARACNASGGMGGFHSPAPLPQPPRGAPKQALALPVHVQPTGTTGQARPQPHSKASPSSTCACATHRYYGASEAIAEAYDVERGEGSFGILSFGSCGACCGACCACVRACVCACVRACVRVWVRACGRARVRARVRACLAQHPLVCCCLRCRVHSACVPCLRCHSARPAGQHSANIPCRLHQQARGGAALPQGDRGGRLKPEPRFPRELWCVVAVGREGGIHTIVCKASGLGQQELCG